MFKSRGNVILLVVTILAVAVLIFVMAFHLFAKNTTTVEVDPSVVPSVSQAQTDEEEKENTSSTVSAASDTVAVTDITLSTEAVTLGVGGTRMPLVTMSPESATDKSEIWTSSNSAVATVSDAGLIRGVAAGSCTVTVSSASNPEVSASVAVTVTR